MKKQIITQHGKPAFVVIPVDEWRRIEATLEDRADAATVRAFLRKPTETFPDTVVAAILGGAHPIKAIREYRGFSQKQLSKAVATSPVYLSQIERGDRHAGRKLRAKLAKALAVDPAMLAREDD